ncbi:WXG100-like domain-containing protein [Nonomuraea sp. 3N208]|uniref:WXG100-like domain-containing protein n=1 Tax=Nonomuraea sp. 3N208 TaxID=3457421 RepID=UPI003FCCE100
MAGAGLAGALAPEFLFGISYLEGDPDRIREAADVLDEIADAVDQHFQEANAAAEVVWQKSSDEAVDEFKTFWNDVYGPAVLAVSLKYRDAANACRAYADVIEKVNHALKVLCWIMTVDMMFTIGYQVLTWKLFQAIMKRQAILLKVTARRFVILLLPTFSYWVADSVAYATGEVVLPLALNYVGGIKTDLSGNDVRSVDYNLTTFREHFVANMAFDAVADAGSALMGKVPGLRTVATNIPLPNGMALNTGSVIPRMAASTTYSMVLDAQHGDNPLPGSEHGLTEEEMYQKFLIHGTRSLIPRAR